MVNPDRFQCDFDVVVQEEQAGKAVNKDVWGMRIIDEAADSTEDGQLFHAIMGTDSTASWAAVPRVGQCDRRVSSGQALRPWSRDFAAILRMLSPVSLRRCAL